MLGRILLLALFLAQPLFAQSKEDVPEPLRQRLEAARDDCEALDNGTLAVNSGAIVSLDLTGDEVDDSVLDYHKLDCSSAPSLFCGTGGCQLDLVVGDHVTEAMSKGWKLVDLGSYNVLLLQVHGSLCGGTNVTPCFEARVWDQEAKAFTTIASPQ